MTELDPSQLERAASAALLWRDHYLTEDGALRPSCADNWTARNAAGDIVPGPAVAAAGVDPQVVFEAEPLTEPRRRVMDEVFPAYTELCRVWQAARHERHPVGDFTNAIDAGYGQDVAEAFRAEAARLRARS